MSELITYTKQQVKEKFNLSDQQLRSFTVTQKTLRNKGIYLSKKGRGQKAIYTLEKIIENPNQIDEGINIDGIQWPRMTLRYAKNIANQKFDKLIPLYRTIDYQYHSKKKQDPAVQWVCKCDCGKYTVALTKQLLTGKKRSCGCLFEAHNWHCHYFEDLTNQKFGKLTVIEYYNLSFTKKSQWKCQCECGNQKIVTTSYLKHSLMPNCGCVKSSFGEKKIEEILKNFNILYKREYSFPDLFSEKKNPLRFDFAVFDTSNNLQYLIEYDGEQHYQKQIDGIWADSFEQRKQRDKLKNNYCLKNHIKLYRIPYWDKDKLNILDDILRESYLIGE